MLEYIKCSGFKSLERFELEFREGLNILVGPNGSGKTNIVLLLEFIGLLKRRSLTEAVSLIGGAGSIFRRIKDSKLTSQILIEVGGSTEASSELSKRNYKIEYVYRVVIELMSANNIIAFKFQRITLKGTRIEDLFETTECDIVCTTLEDGLANVNIISLSDYMLKYHLSNATALEQVRSQIEEYGKYSARTSLFDLLEHIVLGIEEIGLDLIGSKALMIDPQKVRQAEDIATFPLIKYDGTGFAATMFALQPKMGPFMARALVPAMYERPHRLHNEIVSYCTLVNDNITNIEVNSDAFESRLSVFIQMLFDGEHLKLPITLVSDGTAKWLALVAAVVTARSLFAIEEPENFLHPAMQMEIIRLVRSQFEEKRRKSGRFALMTTHSETILNNANPNELVVVDLEGGRTKARRPRNIKQLESQISKTGFGLGYFYARGAIE